MESVTYNFGYSDYTDDSWIPVAPTYYPIYYPIYTQCPQCGLLVESEDRYCRHCGKQLIIEQDKYCSKCGQKLNKEV